MTDIEHQLITTRALLAEAGGTTVDVVARMVERIARLEEEVVELRRSVPVHPSSLTDVFTMLEADLAAETATRTALRTQESRISGILANAGVAAGDLVRGVASLVGQLEEARLQRVDAQAAAEEYRQACARLRAQVAALQDDNRQLGGREDWVREQALREAAGVLRDASKKHRNDAKATRSIAASGGHVLAADILGSYANVIDTLDAAPAAEVSDG